ncbi:MAG TPA: fibronectin type III domain-containing protein [Thermoanaerobaculia bacterium]|nr:fibronectin type III domain-containing protein [Thermoanaerobaculia bacterium]
MAVRALALALLAVLTVPGAAGLFPLTNMRYDATVYGEAVLRSNGSDVFAFWAKSEHPVMMSKFVSGQWSPGHPVPGLHSFGGSLDAVWTGTHFFVVTSTAGPDGVYALQARLVDEHGRPAGSAITLRTGRSALVKPRLAASRSRIFLSAQSWLTYDIDALVLSLDGKVRSSASVTGRGTEEKVASNGSGFATLTFTPEAPKLSLRVYDAGVGMISETVLSTQRTPGFALASDGSRYLAAWTEEDGLHTALFDGSGAPLRASLVAAEARDVVSENAAWNGRGWTLAFGTWNRGTLIASLDEAAQAVETVEPLAGYVPGRASFASTSNDTFVAWPSLQRSSSLGFVARLPLVRNDRAAITMAPNDQELLAAASSDTAVLVVWTENTALYAGVRTKTGQWIERELLSGYSASAAAAASDGRNFVVIADEYESSNGAMLFRLNDAGAPIVPPQRLGPGKGQVAIAWNGSSYAVYRGGEIHLLSPRGGLFAPKTIHGIDVNPVLASDGRGFLLAGDRTACCCYLNNCFPIGVSAVRLGPDLRVLDEEGLDLASGSGSHAGAIWNGEEYIVAWGYAVGYGSRDAGLARIPRSSGPPQSLSIASFTEPASLFAMDDGQFAIAYDGTVRVLTPEGSVVSSSILDPGAAEEDRPLLLRLGGDGTYAYVASRAQHGEPHSGAKRIAMSILSPTPHPLPSSPGLTVARHEDRLDVSWSAPAGSVNGYRVEWRVDDRAWIEAERWLDSAELRTTMAIPHGASTVSVRVRAFNDGGAGAYSTEVRTDLPSRRRAAQ